MKTLLGIVGCAVVIIGAAYALPWLKPLAGQVKQETNQALARQMSDEGVYNEANDEINHRVESLRSAWTTLAENKGKLSDTQSRRDQQARQLANKEADLRQASEWLKSHQAGDSVILGGKTYTYVQVVDDSKTKVVICNGLREAIASLDESILTMSQAIDQSKDVLEKAAAGVQSMKSNLVAKQVVLDAMRAAQVADADAQRLASSIDGGSTALNTMALEELDKRIVHAKSDREFTARVTATSSDGISWSNEGAVSQDDLSIIKEYEVKFLDPPVAVETTATDSKSQTQ